MFRSGKGKEIHDSKFSQFGLPFNRRERIKSTNPSRKKEKRDGKEFSQFDSRSHRRDRTKSMIASRNTKKT